MKYLHICFILISLSFSQIQYGGAPSYEYHENDINFIIVDHENIIEYDMHPMVLHYANEYSVNIDVLESSTKIYGRDETTFYLGIESTGAMAIGFYFDEWNLTDNTEMFIYDEEKSMYIGSFNSKNNDYTSTLSTAVVKSDRVIIEITVPNDELSNLRLHMDIVTHDFIDIMNFNDTHQSDRVDCNDNVACPFGNNWEEQIDAVVIVSGNGGLCSGAVVNNTLNDKTPYILYAAHCVGGGSNTIYFNYQASSCNGTSPSGYNTMSGTTNRWVGNFNSIDGALIEMNNNIPDSYGAYYAGWNKSSSNPGNNVVGIHHPDGWIKKISYDAYGMSSNGNWWDFAYGDGRVIPGSSGSPFFDDDKRVRGMCSYMYTNYCNPSPDCYCSQTYYHGYAKFSSAWNYIDQYLDPNNSNVTYIDGTYDGNVDIYGCTDPNADNYDPDATIDDGSCIYGSVELAFGNFGLASVEILVDSDEDIGGFQFTIEDSADIITVTGADGGLADEYNFEVSTSELGIVIGFSFSGDVIPAGSGVLTNILFETSGSGNTTVCINNPIISDANGQGLSASGDCAPVDFAAGSAALSFGDVDMNSIEVFMENSVDVAGFQFTLTDSSNLITLTGAEGGLAEENGFTVSVNGNTGIVIGFSLTGSVIPEGSALLTNLLFDSSGFGQTELCMNEVIISDTNGIGLLASGDCIDTEISDAVSGDINADGILNVQDVVMLINFILGNDIPEGNEFYLADLNGDGILNVQDVVTLINLILD